MLRRSPAFALSLLVLAELSAMSLWFSASAVIPHIEREWHITPADQSWFVIAVQLGFVAGAFASAVFNLPDIFKTRHFFVACAILAAGTNVYFALITNSVTGAIVTRFLTGFFLAGVYPPGMKLLATWFQRGRGAAIGVLVGALTVGKASPYLINALSTGSWRTDLLVTSALAAGGAVLVLFFLRDGPYTPAVARFDWRSVWRAFGNRGVRLANFGYFGHMWELYAMWAWIPVFLRDSFAVSGHSHRLADAGSFLVIGAGAAGCVGAGFVADRVGRTLTTIVAMAVSGLSSIAIGFCYGGPAMILLVLATIWGISVVADSAQFSTCITELSQPEYVGTALTIQTSVGFLVTVLTIRLIPLLTSQVGWRYSFASLAIGPALGIVAMARLRSSSQATQLAGGKR